jgi:hypothetical protein
MKNLVKTEYNSSDAEDVNRFLNNKDTQSLAERFNNFLLENYHYKRSFVLGQILGTRDRELQLLMMAHYLFSEMLLLRKELDAEDNRREVLLDTACDIATFIQKMCGVWVL